MTQVRLDCNHGDRNETHCMSIRRLRFALLEKIALPLLTPLLRLWIASWRLVEPDAELLKSLAARPRLVLLTFHGMLAQTLAFAHLSRRYRRPFVVLLSPSLDGRLLAAFLARFGVGHAFATSGRRAVAGTRELARRVAAGDVAIVAVDGPRGPRGVAKPGALRLAQAIGAELILGTTTASAGFTFPSWDRPLIPYPFARVTLDLHHSPAAEIASLRDLESQVRDRKFRR
jgi:lysophospholipid acyltransferase (LPLAT)-like uncharacterized protein